MRRFGKFGCCLVAIAGIVAAATGETIDATIFRQKLLITPTAGKVTSTFANFPVLVRLSAARQPGFDPAACGVNGADIRFALEDGTLLAHDVDTWSLTGESLVWVNVPSLTASTKIVAYWGLEGGKTAPEVEHGGAWPNFIAVWHLSEESGVALDASKNRYDSTNGSSVASSSDVAVIGRSRNVKGDQFKTGVLTLANPDAKRPLTHVAKFTVSGWMRDSSSTETGYRVLITKGAWGADGWAVQTQNCRNKISGVGYNQSMRTWTFPNGKTLAGQWHYLTVSFNNGIAQSWLDGMKIESSWSSVQAPNESATHQLVFAGNMTGYVDEMRMMDGATSDAWVAADYAAQTDADFLSYGGVVATWFAVKPIAKQVYVPGGAPCEPIPTIVDTATGAELDAKDFTFTWTDNTARGTGTVKVTAKGGSAGDQVSADFTIVNGYYVTGYTLAKEGDGLSWGSAMSLTNAIAVAAADDALMLKAGVYPVAAQLTISKPLTLKGGYAGTDDVTLAADPVSTLDGQGTAENVVNATAASGEQTFLRMAFVNGKNRGFNKSGAGAITLVSCRFANNGTQVSGQSGRGAYLSGTAGTTVAVVSNCVFEGNAQCTYAMPDGWTSRGFAILAEKLASLTIDDTLFLTNGAGPSAESGYNSVARQGNFRGSAIYANAVPVTARRCQFRANRATSYSSSGGCVWLEGACGGSVFDHCLWVGNYENWGWGDTSAKASTHSGALVLNLSSASDTATVRSSTIAYNIAGLKDSATGISVGKGKLKLVDSVLYGNRVSGASNKGDVGRDLALTTGDGFADVSYTLFTSDDVASVSSVVAGNLKLVAGVVYGDPLFVTGLEEAMSHVGSWGNTSTRYKAEDLAEVLAFDVHLRTSAGYVTNGAPTEWQEAEKGVASPAIDAGDPDAAWTNEQGPNGSRLNAGFYGNTAEASKSVTSETPLGFADMTVSYPDGYSRPVIGFTATGDAGCVIDAKATVTVDGGDPFELSIPGCAVGKLQEIALSDYYARNASVVVAFSGRSSAGSVTPSEFDFTVDRDPAPWSGHGGGEGVLHVREGAMGAKNGSSWTDAFDNIDDALSLAAADATKTNIWIAGTLVSHKAVTDRSVKAAKLEIRGGFVGDEDSADERKRSYSTLSGEDAQDMVSINNAADHDVVFERICFTRGLNRALNKSGAGAIAIFDCRFLNNGTAVKGQSGRGVYLVGSSASTVAVISNCVFEGNAQCTYATPDGSKSKGFAIYAENLASLTLDDTLFVTNGAGVNAGTDFNSVARQGNFYGSAIYAEAVPVTARRCQFRANRASCYGSSGGCVWLEGACGGSVFDRCLWVGNYETFGYGGNIGSSTKAGALVLNLANADDTVTVRGSTIAYNLAGLKMSSAGISVAKGKLILSDSIVFGNRVSGDPGNVGSDLALTTADGYADVSYSLLSATDSTSASAAIAGNLKFVKGVVAGDPLFVTTPDEAHSHVSGWTTTGLSARYKASDIGQVLAFDVHLRTSAGYVTNGAPTEWQKAEKGVVSPAIDAGDPTEECVEPEPNGGCRNAGFYGNTPEASKTVTSEIPLGFTDVTIDYPDGYSRPVIGFTVTGDPGCVVNVMAKVAIGDADPFDVLLPGCVAGAAQEIVLSEYYDRGTTIRVSFFGDTTAGAVTPKECDFTVDRDPAPWSGHGGGEGVLHVREGAMGAKDGSNWTDAFDNLDDALSLAAVDATKTNVWIAGTLVSARAVVSRAVAAAKLEIRGGFAGDEDSADERKLPYSTLSGEDAQDMVSINNAAGHNVVFERICFTRGLNRALNKSGNGAISIFDCRFLNNGTAVRGQSGRGVYLSGSAALTAAVISNCVFAGNAQCRYETPDSYGGKGFAIYAENLASLTLDDTLFVTNGAGPGSATGWNTVGREGHFFGSAIYASASPVTARRCQFRANRATCYGSAGGCVWLEGACGGSLFDHCLWTGNYEAWGHGGSASASTKAGALVVNLANTDDTVTVRHSTIAYNIAELKNSAAGISVAKGKLLLSDSIVFGNRVLEESATLGADLALTTADGYAHVGYTLFSTNDASSVGALALGNRELGEGVVYGDPLLMTGLEAALSHVNGWSGSSHNMYYKPADIAEVAAFNVHLRGGSGYRDENSGQVVTKGAFTRLASPALDAGDPAAKCVEPVPNGWRVNLGYYGNTPWATLSRDGTLIMVR